jgi:hypothetical protein
VRKRDGEGRAVKGKGTKETEISVSFIDVLVRHDSTRGLVNLLSAHVSTRQGSIGVHLERRFTLRLPGSSLPASSGNVAASPGGTLGRGAGGVAAGNAR